MKMIVITLTPGSAHALRTIAAKADPVSHSSLDCRAAHRLIRDARFVRYASLPTSGVMARRTDPHYTLTPVGEAVVEALPDVIPDRPFTIQLATH